MVEMFFYFLITYTVVYAIYAVVAKRSKQTNKGK